MLKENNERFKQFIQYQNNSDVLTIKYYREVNGTHIYSVPNDGTPGAILGSVQQGLMSQLEVAGQFPEMYHVLSGMLLKL